MSKKGWINITGLFASLLTIIIVIFEFFLKEEALMLKITILISFFCLFLILLLVWLLSQNRKERNIKIAILGEVLTGKTFYFGVLFHFLQYYENEKYLIYPYGSQTIARILYYSNWIIEKRELFPCTCVGENECLEGKAEKKIAFVKKKIHFIMSDNSGEEFRRISLKMSSDSSLLEETRSLPLSETTYFDRIVLTSDCIFLMISIDFIWGNSDNDNFDNVQNNYIAALQAIANNEFKSKSKVPLALIISKSDLMRFYNVNEEETLNKLNKVIQVINKRFSINKVFFVSAIEQKSPKDYRDYLLHPKGIENPIIWCLEVLG